MVEEFATSVVPSHCLCFWLGLMMEDLLEELDPAILRPFALSSMIVWPLASTVSLSLEIVWPLASTVSLIWRLFALVQQSCYD